MFGFLAGGAVVKFVKSLITPRNIVIFVVSLAVLYGGYRGYNWIYDRGAAHQLAADNKTIERLTKERNKAVDDKNTYVAAYNDWVRTTKDAQAQFMREQGVLIKNLSDQLADANKRAADKQKVIYRDVPKYIPAEVDAVVHLPLGFVRLYSESLQGEAASDAALGPISFGEQGNAGAASGVTLSSFAGLASWNNVECVRRGRLLGAWQYWYGQSRDQFTRAQQAQFDSIPKVTEDGPPTEPLPAPVQ